MMEIEFGQKFYKQLKSEKLFNLTMESLNEYVTISLSAIIITLSQSITYNSKILEPGDIIIDLSGYLRIVNTSFSYFASLEEDLNDISHFFNNRA